MKPYDTLGKPYYCYTKEVTLQLIQNLRDFPKMKFLKHVSFDFNPV